MRFENCFLWISQSKTAFGIIEERMASKLGVALGSIKPPIAFKHKADTDNEKSTWDLLIESGCNTGLLTDAAFEGSSLRLRRVQDEVILRRQALKEGSQNRKMAREKKRLEKYSAKINKEALVQSKGKSKQTRLR